MDPTKSAVNKISPITIGRVLDRDRLFALLRQDLPTKAFWISGPGGSGKTTLIASYLERGNQPCLWYQIDALDGDPATFFYYFGQAATSLLVSADPPLPLLTPEYLPHIDVFILRYFEALYQRIKPDSWLIFDNFQDAPDESTLSQLLAAAVRQLPPHVTIAFLSRSAPPPIMVRFIANQTMRPIGWNQLAFTPNEFTAFLESSDSRFAIGDTESLYQMTKGWIAGAILWLLSYRGDPLLSTLPKDYAQEHIFGYFASEILEKSGAEIRHFLLQTALLPHMTAEMAAELTGMAAEEILEILYRQNFFLEKRRLPEISYQYHPLFHEFLLQQAERVFGVDALRIQLCNAAAILENRGLPEEAIRLYQQAEAYVQMHAIIISLAQSLINQGRYAVLANWIGYLPENYIEKHPWLIFWQGISNITSNPQESSMLCTRAYELFARQDDLIGQVISWSAVIDTLMIMRKGFTQLDQWISEGDRLGNLLPENEESVDLVGRFSAGMLLALLLCNQGHPDLEKWQIRCESLLDRCQSRQVAMDLMKNLCWSYNCLGQGRKSLTIESRIKLFLQTENLQPLQQILSNVLLAHLSFNKGHLRECNHLVENSIQQAQETGIHFFDFMALGYNVYCDLGVGNHEQAFISLTRLKSFLSPYAIWDHGQYHYLLAWYTMQIGDMIGAQRQLESAVHFVRSCGNPFTLALCQILQSQIYLELGNFDKAEDLLGNILNDTRLGHSGTINFLVDLAFAGCAYMQNKVKEAQQYCKSAFFSVNKEGAWMPFGLSHGKLRIICAKALEAGIEENSVLESIKLWRLTPPEEEITDEQWPWPVCVYTLGRFEIHRAGKPLVLSAKTPRKPLELLSLLICAGQTGISREKIADKLWSDSDGDLAIRSLNTTLHRLRKLLGSNDTVVQKGDRLMLNSNLCWVDSWHFQRLGQKIELSKGFNKEKMYISRALSLYHGSFTTGYEDLDLAIDYSSQLNKQWLVVAAAAVPYFAAMDLEERPRLLIEQALAKDETAAAVFFVLISTFNNVGRISELSTILDRCQSLLAAKGTVLGPNALVLLKNLSAR